MRNKIALEGQCREVLAFVEEHGRLPTQKDKMNLYVYVYFLRNSYKAGTLDKSIIKRLYYTGIFEPKITGNGWENNFALLVEFRKQNPNRWPSQCSEDIVEKKIGKWSISLRWKYRQNKLSHKCIHKLREIGFELNMNVVNAIWQQNFEFVKLHIEENETLNGLSKRLLKWSNAQYLKYYDENDAVYQVQLLDSINLFKYIVGSKTAVWEEKYAQLKDFICTNNKKPSKKTNLNLFNWWVTHRRMYNEGSLSENRIKLFNDLGYKVGIKRENYETAWNRNFNKLIQFRKANNDRWPYSVKKGTEREIYLWCQAQRVNKKKMDKGLMKVYKERIMKLDSIGFVWDKIVLLPKRWDMMLGKLKKQLKVSEKIPYRIKGEFNPLYRWVQTNKKRIKDNVMLEDRKARFLAVMGVSN